MKYPAPDGLIGSLYQFHGYGKGSLLIQNSLWIVVAAWKGDGRGRPGARVDLPGWRDHTDSDLWWRQVA